MSSNACIFEIMPYAIMIKIDIIGEGENVATLYRAPL